MPAPADKLVDLQIIPLADDPSGDALRIGLLFIDSDDLRFWENVLGAWPLSTLVRRGDQEAVVRTFLGKGPAANRGHWDAWIIVFERSGLAGEGWLKRHETCDIPRFYLRILPKAEMSPMESDVPPLDALLGDVHDRTGAFPLLLPMESPKSAPVLRQFLSVVFDAAAAQRRYALATNRRNWARRLAEQVVHQPSASHPTAKRLTRQQLGQLLVWRKTLKGIRHDLTESRRTTEKARYDVDHVRQLGCLDLPRRQYEQIERDQGQVNYSFSHGDVMARAACEKFDRARRFADALPKSGDGDLAQLRRSLESTLHQRPPVLAIIGSFSSGKTTLLNALLLSVEANAEAGKPLFRTKTTANTAIVSEVRYAESRDKEIVTFQFCTDVEHRLFAPSDDGLEPSAQPSMTFWRNAECLLELLDSGLLQSPSIDFVMLNGCRDTRVGNLREVRDVLGKVKEWSGNQLDPDWENRIRSCREVVFRAEVDQSRLGQRLRSSIPLGTPDGWRMFQGDGRNEDPLIERPEAAFLIKSADVSLHNPLLRLTTIADTPGTGSVNDRHDAVTSRYLNCAEAFILLMPTKNAHSTRVRQILERLATEMKRRHRGDASAGVRSIAFVANCFTSQTPKQQLDRVLDYEGFVCQAFEIDQPQWRVHRDKCFFAVNVTDFCQGEHADELYGYRSGRALRKWVEDLLSRDAYQTRIRKAVAVVDVDWRTRRRVLEDRQQELTSHSADLLEKVDRIRQFASRGFPDLLQEETARLDALDRRLKTGAKGAAEALNAYAGDCLEKDDLEGCGRRIRTFYSDVNDLIEEMTEDGSNGQVDSALEGRRDDICRRLANCAVSMPCLELPDPQAQSVPWSFALRLDTGALDQKVKSLLADWPGFWSKVTRVFTLGLLKDKREKIAESFGEYVRARTRAVLDPLKTYLGRCRSSLDVWREAVAAGCEKRVRELASSSDAEENRRQLETVNASLAEFCRLDSERKSLIEELEK